MAKKIGVSVLLLFMLFVSIAETPSKAALAQLKAAFDGEAGVVVDSTGSYEYTVNEDGTAKIIRYLLKEEKEVMIPSQIDGYNVTVIGPRAFYNSTSTSIQIPDTVTDIGDSAFCYSKISSMIIPESVIRIERYAFGDCANLEKVYISRNVEEMEGNVFLGAGKLTEIKVDSRNAVYTSVDGILYSKDMTELLAVPGGKDLVGFQFPGSVVCIGTEAFGDNEFFTEITIPDQVTTLKSAAFINCCNLVKIVIGKGVEEIENSTFMGCENLSEVVVTGSLKKIGDRAFDSCAFTEIIIPDGVTEIGASAFDYCHALKKVTIPDSVTEIGHAAFYDCGFKNITIPESVQKIGRCAIGFEGEDCDKIRGMSITGYRDTGAYYYAKEAMIDFHDAETGEDIRFDLLPVPIPRGKITVLKARKKKIELEYELWEDVSYQIAVKKAGASSWKKYYETNPWAVIKGLKPGKQYKVKVRAWREIDRKYYYGKWSKVKKVTVR